MTGERLLAYDDLVAIATRIGRGEPPIRDAGLLQAAAAATPDQVRSNVAAATLRLDDDTLAEALAYADKPDDYWAARSHRAWA